MSRYDWRDRDEPRRRMDARDREDFGQADYSEDWSYDPDARSGYRAAERMDARDDYGQADYSDDWKYDRERGPYRGHADERRLDEDRYEGRDERRGEPRSWLDRAGDFLAGRDDEGRGRTRRRRGPSDRVLWAVIVERLKDHRGLDLHDVEVLVEDGEVTLNGTVRRKEEKRRIEDIADVDGVRHLQNNLRVRDRGHWTFL